MGYTRLMFCRRTRFCHHDFYITSKILPAGQRVPLDTHYRNHCEVLRHCTELANFWPDLVMGTHTSHIISSSPAAATAVVRSSSNGQSSGMDPVRSMLQGNSQYSQLPCSSFLGCLSAVKSAYMFSSRRCNQNARLYVLEEWMWLEVCLKVPLCSAFTPDSLGGFKEFSVSLSSAVK